MTTSLESENPVSRFALTRRDFAKALGSATIVASVPVGPRPAAASSLVESSSETAVARFHGSLSADQRKTICFPFDHPLRTQISNHWAIVRPAIRDLTREQEALCREVFKSLCSDEGYERFLKQMESDYGGFDRYHVALFGAPATENPFEWVLTGRHNTLRADGNRMTGPGFGGPIFYGHASPISDDTARNRDNVWWYQGELANKVLQSLDARQRARAIATSRRKRREGEALSEVGLAVGSLDGLQKALVRDLLNALVRPFRAFAVPEVKKCLREEESLDSLRLTYFKDGDIGDASGCAIWKLDGLGFAWYFHGVPHVHAWLNVAMSGLSA